MRLRRTLGAVATTLIPVLLLSAKRFPSAVEMHEHFLNGECADCHPAIYKEWASSGHSLAWRSPLYQRLRDRYAAPKNCDPCHAPLPVHQTGVGAFPRARPADRDSGVDCLTCHLSPDGAMRGPYEEPSPFHRVQREPTLFTAEVTLCATCHGQDRAQAHNQVRDFKQSPSFRRGENCQTCHMPEVTRKPSRLSRTAKRGGAHLWLGSRTQPWLQSTVLLDVEPTEGGFLLYLTNAAAHRIPAAPLREMRLGIVARSANGTVLLNRAFVWTHPLNPNGSAARPDAPDTRLNAEEARIETIPLPNAPGATVRAQLMYRRAVGEKWVTMAVVQRRL
jgi:hypothetical protein